MMEMYMMEIEGQTVEEKIEFWKITLEGLRIRIKTSKWKDELQADIDSIVKELQSLGVARP